MKAGFRTPARSPGSRWTAFKAPPYDDGRGGLSLEDPEQISLAIQLHRAAIQLKGESAGEEDWTVSSDQETMTFLYLHLYYELADGTVLERNYPALPIVESDRDVEGVSPGLRSSSSLTGKMWSRCITSSILRATTA